MLVERSGRTPTVLWLCYVRLWLTWSSYPIHFQFFLSLLNETSRDPSAVRQFNGLPESVPALVWFTFLFLCSVIWGFLWLFCAPLECEEHTFRPKILWAYSEAHIPRYPLTDDDKNPLKLSYPTLYPYLLFQMQNQLIWLFAWFEASGKNNRLLPLCTAKWITMCGFKWG